MIRKIVLVIMIIEICGFIIIMGSGINRTISMSNTIKITANRKNRVENGIRADRVGSNPHSKGEIFSRSLIDRNAITHARIISSGGKIRANIEELDNSVIY